jgi:DNA-binding MarR family transcriptional regulator
MNADLVWSAAGEAATDVILSTFRANGAFLASGNRIAGAVGLTSARWQVLGAIAQAQRPLTVPQIARRMGLTRQSTQATVSQLRRDGFVAVGENPDHRRSPVIVLTEPGRQRFTEVDRKQISWVNQLAAGMDPDELAITARVLRELTARLNAGVADDEKETEEDEVP